MIKGLAITPPIIGRISIGRVVEKNGKRLPEKDDQFTITTQIQHKDGWLLHPCDELLRQQISTNPTVSPTTSPNPNGKLRSIPVRMLFDDPALNLRAEYSLFDRSTGRPICVGNGEQCTRMTATGMQSLPCPSPTLCTFAAQGHCKPYGRLTVRIDLSDMDMPMNDQDQSAQQQPATQGYEQDELGVFIFRTTGFNSIRTLAARLSYWQAYSGGLLSCLPLQLKLRGKSTTQSHRSPIFYVDLCLRDGLSMAQAMTQARQHAEDRHSAGLQQNQLEQAARQGFSNALFEHSPDDTAALLEEFYPVMDQGQDEGYPPSTPPEPIIANPDHPSNLPQAQQPPTNRRLNTQLNRQLQQTRHAAQTPTLQPPTPTSQPKQSSYSTTENR
jgi:hypothetical protein